jgi:hypothetical protein
MKVDWFKIIVALFLWVYLSVIASHIKSDSLNCDVSYPIDYILFTGLFCEIKESK